MATYKIKGVDLSEKTGFNPSTISSWRSRTEMPTTSAGNISKLFMAICELADQERIDAYGEIKFSHLLTAKIGYA